ncbi:hypothetical protein [Nitrospira sp. Nam74]
MPVRGLNTAGDVVGSFLLQKDSHLHGFVLTIHGFTLFDVLGAIATEPFGNQ